MLPYFCRKSLYNAVFYGIMSGFSDGMFYFIYAVVFRYGAFAVTVNSDNVAYVNYKELITLVLLSVVCYIFCVYSTHITV